MSRAYTDTNVGFYANMSYTHEHATAFQVTQAKTGYFVRTVEHGAILCRVASGSVYFYDAQKKKDIEVSLDILNRLAAE